MKRYIRPEIDITEMKMESLLAATTPNPVLDPEDDGTTNVDSKRHWGWHEEDDEDITFGYVSPWDE